MKKLRVSVTAALGLALLYLGWTFLDRYFTSQRMEHAIKARQAAAWTNVPDFARGTAIKIVQFYAAPGVIGKGEKAILCYSVVNAKTVELAPPVERVWPALNRCFDVRPEKDTRYTLTARDAEGKSVSESFVLQVKPWQTR
jgi:hypothetical protein